MKYLTITVPCYNSQQYLRRCLDSLVVCTDGVEVIVVNDGSTDETGAIAEEYASRYPDMVSVVHKENGGHGSAVNAGLALASGKYFKVVDSDDWLKERAYRMLLNKIEVWCKWEETRKRQICPELLVCDYTYNHLDIGTQRRMRYGNVFAPGKICTWNQIGHFRPSQYLIMHALVYRTDILRKSGLILPEHTFYVDNLFAYCPLPYVENICYLPVNLYQYYLGRDDQSVNEKVLIARIEQQIKVTKLVAESVDLRRVRARSPKLARYMYRNVSIMMAISSIHLLLKGDDEAKLLFRELWSDMKRSNAGLYYRLRFTCLCGLTNLPGRLGKKATIAGYRLAKKVYKFQ